MQRRKFIAGVGSLAAGAAAITGTGAFTSVSADRSLTVQTAGDAGAFLGITKATNGAGGTGSPTPNAQEYVEISGDGVVSIDLASSDDSSGSASGVNQDAKTIFDNLIDITNNGTQTVELSVESNLIASQGGFLGIYAENTQGDSADNTGLSDDTTSQTTTLAPGESATNIGIYIPKGSSSPSDVNGGTLTFIAERTGGNQD